MQKLLTRRFSAQKASVFSVVVFDADLVLADSSSDQMGSPIWFPQLGNTNRIVINAMNFRFIVLMYAL